MAIKHEDIEEIELNWAKFCYEHGIRINTADFFKYQKAYFTAVLDSYRYAGLELSRNKWLEQIKNKESIIEKFQFNQFQLEIANGKPTKRYKPRKPK